jgi:hypothetical protein
MNFTYFERVTEALCKYYNYLVLDKNGNLRGFLDKPSINKNGDWEDDNFYLGELVINSIALKELFTEYPQDYTKFLKIAE